MSDNPWIDIRNSAGHLLFRYNPFTNEIEMRIKGITYELIKLNEIRSNCGVIEFQHVEAGRILVIQERKNGSV